MSRRAKHRRRASRGGPKHSNSPRVRGGSAVRPESGSRKRWLAPGVCIFLAAAVFAVFGQTIGYGFVEYDDDDYVYDNPPVAHGLNLKAAGWAFTHIHSANWHPLTTLTHMLDCQVYGVLHPWGHHLGNVLLHAAAVVLLFLVLRQMTGALWRSAFVAAVFAVHPLHVESVAWVSERKDVLSGLFFMLTLMAYVRYVRTNDSRSDNGLSFLRSPAYWLVLLLFAFGLMSKPMLVTLPFVLLLLDWWPLERLTNQSSRSRLWSLVREKIPLLLLCAGSCVATIWAQQAAINDLDRITLVSRGLNAVVSYAAYISQMFCPIDLAVLYPHPANHVPAWMIAVSALALLIVSIAVVVGARKHPYLPVGWLWYLGMLIPVIGLVQVGGQARADRYTYLPQVGLYIMMAWGAVDLCSSWRHRHLALSAAAAVIVVSLLMIARVQATYWKDTVSLMSHTIACTSNNSIAEGILGKVLADQGKLAEAVQHQEQALKRSWKNPEAHNNLGLTLAREGKLPEAIRHYEIALQQRPKYAEAYNNLGSALADEGKFSEAVEQYGRALELKPEYAEAYNNLGLVLARQGKLDEAIQKYEQAIQSNPDYAEAYNNVGLALAAGGKFAEATERYEQALRYKPDYAEACNNLGLALARQGKLTEAIQQYEHAIKLKPDYVEALNNLGYMLATSDDRSIRNGARATDLLQKANQLTGGENPVILGTLAAAYAETGRYSDAIETVRHAIERAETEGRSNLVTSLQTHLERYQATAAGSNE